MNQWRLVKMVVGSLAVGLFAGTPGESRADGDLLTWEKQGVVISPAGAPAWRRGHSGMCSAITLANGNLRVFLTGRDEAGRFQIGRLDLHPDLTPAAAGDQPVLSAGRMGCFDSNGVCMPSVVRISDRRLFMYYVGWGITQPPFFVNRCGLAISEDEGLTWTRRSEAPLDLLDGNDPIGIGTVCILRENDRSWRMWYTTFREWRSEPNGAWTHYYHIKYAESEDGIHWIKPNPNIAIDFVGQEYAIGRPWVIREADGYRMWFSTRSHGGSYRIGYAVSSDGRSWTRRPAGIDPSPSGWDSEMIEYAWVMPRARDYLMLYNGNGFGASGTGWAVARRDLTPPAAVNEKTLPAAK
jgi:hypothetical protein